MIFLSLFILYILIEEFRVNNAILTSFIILLSIIMLSYNFVLIGINTYSLLFLFYLISVSVDNLNKIDKL